MKLYCLLFCCLFLLSSNAEWELEYDKDGIQVYTRKIKGSSLKEVKTEMIQPHNIHDVLTIFNPQEELLKWMYKLKEAKLIGTNRLYYAIDFPWPLSDRDLIGISTEYFNSDTSHVIFSMEADPTYIEEKEAYVRMQDVSGKWEFRKLSDSTTLVSNLLHADPNGIPNWIVNLFAIDGPVKSYHNMSEALDERFKR